MTTPKPQGTPEPLVPLTEEDCMEIDMLDLRFKQSGGPNRDNEARALRLQMNEPTGKFQ